MILPTITSGGTHKSQLVGNLNDAGHALERALGSLRMTAPDSRDYQGRGRDLHGAVQAHCSRVNRLEEIKSEIDAMMLAIDRIPGPGE